MSTAVAMSDGGGVKQAMLRPIVGAETLARLVVAPLDMIDAEVSLEPAQVHTRRGIRPWWWPKPLRRYPTSEDKLHLVIPTDAPDWVTELLFQCHTLHVEVRRASISAADKQTCMEMIFMLAAQLLRVVDAVHQPNGPAARAMALVVAEEDGGDVIGSRSRGHVGPADGRVGQETAAAGDPSLVYRSQLLNARNFYERSAQRSAQLTYFWGMLGGVAVLGVKALLLLNLLNLPLTSAQQDLPPRDVLVPIAAMGVGALGAVVIVMQRMSSGSLSLRYQERTLVLWLVGGFRPLIGAIFGVLLYVLVTADLLPLKLPTVSEQSPADPVVQFFIALAFFAGFSERFAQDMVATGQSQLSTAGQPRRQGPRTQRVARAAEDAVGHARPVGCAGPRSLAKASQR